jgi:phosphomevalonate kinase
MITTVSAPGKVVIMGEYAVLEGAPSLVMAIDRRVRVSLRPSDEPECMVAAPGMTSSRGRFRLGPSGMEWLDGNAALFRLPIHVIRAFLGLTEGGRAFCGSFDLTLDSTALMDRNGDRIRKLGLGSSAALTVALWHVLGYHAASHHDTVVPDGLESLIDIHAGLQGRRGSGLDVAASLYGGLIEYSRAPTPRARAASLPQDLAHCFVWSGHEATTGSFLARIDQWRRDNERTYRQAMSALAAIARAGAEAARGNDAEAFIESLDEYAAALQALGTASGTDILSEPHKRLRRLARQCGVVYKPCGAGGGDIGICVSRDSGALARFRNSVIAAKFQLLSLNSERDGVKTHPGETSNACKRI